MYSCVFSPCSPSKTSRSLCLQCFLTFYAAKFKISNFPSRYLKFRGQRYTDRYLWDLWHESKKRIKTKPMRWKDSEEKIGLERFERIRNRGLALRPSATPCPGLTQRAQPPYLRKKQKTLLVSELLESCDCDVRNYTTSKLCNSGRLSCFCEQPKL